MNATSLEVIASVSTAAADPVVTPRSPIAVPLTELQPGTMATLCEARVDDDTRSLLRSLGLTDACRLRLCKRGEPCILQVRSARIGISEPVARCLFVVAHDV